MSKREHYCIGDKDHAPKPYHYKECGLSNIYLLNGFELEEHDGEQYVSIHDVNGLWKAIGFNIVTKKKVLTPKEIRFLRSQMEKTQNEIAAFLRVDDQTVARWEKGKVKLSGPADIALRAMYLASDIAQPEGKEILYNWMESIGDLIEQDSPLADAFLFEKQDSNWNAQAYA